MPSSTSSLPSFSTKNNPDTYESHVQLEKLDLKQVTQVIQDVSEKLEDVDTRVLLARQLKAALHSVLRNTGTTTNVEAVDVLSSAINATKKKDDEVESVISPKLSFTTSSSQHYLDTFDLWEPILLFSLDWPQSYTTLRLAGCCFCCEIVKFCFSRPIPKALF